MSNNAYGRQKNKVYRKCQQIDPTLDPQGIYIYIYDVERPSFIGKWKIIKIIEKTNKKNKPQKKKQKKQLKKQTKNKIITIKKQ